MRTPHNRRIQDASSGGTAVLRRAAPYVWLASLAFVVLFWRLGAASFWDPDEAHYAQTTRELIQTGDWLAPYYAQQPFFDKPVLFHLLQALPMSAFGLTPFSARLVPALAALGLILTTWWLGTVLASADVGLLAAALLTVSPGVFGLSRYAILDSLFTAFLFGGVSCLAVAALKDRARLQYPGYLLLALATLTKGPLALALSGLALLIAVLASREARRRLLALHWILGLAIVVALSAPWFLYMLHRFGSDFVNGYFLNENITLFSRPPYGNQPGWSFYLQILAVGLLPWTFLVLGRLADDARGALARTAGVDTFEVLLWSWTGAIVGFFTLSAFKLDHYVFPAAPALCLLAARAWTDARQRGATGAGGGAGIGIALIGPTLVVAGTVAGALMVIRLALPAAALAAPAALVVAGVGMIVDRHRGTLPRVPWGAISAFGVMYAVVILVIGPALEQWKVIPDVAQWVAAHAADETQIAAYKLDRWDPALRFYVPRPMKTIRELEGAQSLAAGGAPFYCVMRESDYEDLVAHGLPLEVVYSKAGMWATSGKALWRRRGELTTFVVATSREHPARASERYNSPP